MFLESFRIVVVVVVVMLLCCCCAVLAALTNGLNAQAVWAPKYLTLGHTEALRFAYTLTRLMAFVARINLAKRFFPHTHTTCSPPHAYTHTHTLRTLVFPAMATNVTRFI